MSVPFRSASRSPPAAAGRGSYGRCAPSSLLQRVLDADDLETA